MLLDQLPTAAQPFATWGGTAPCRWSVVEGTLPAGDDAGGGRGPPHWHADPVQDLPGAAPGDRCLGVPRHNHAEGRHSRTLCCQVSPVA
jgi:hypothetical protein